MNPIDIIVIAVILVIIGLVTAYLIHVKRRGGCAGCPYGSECKGGCNGSCGSNIKAAEGRDYSESTSDEPRKSNHDVSGDTVADEATAEK